MMSPVRIVCVLGSPHRRGNSAAIAERFCKSASLLGAQVRSFFLNELNFRGCQGCLACKTGHDRCVQVDDLTAVLEAIGESDALVVATPVYLSDVTGQLKLFIDRTFSFTTPKFKHAPPVSRLRPGKKLVFIQTQSQTDETRFSDIYRKYGRMFKVYGFNGFHLIMACGVSFQGEAENRADLMELAEQKAGLVMAEVMADRNERQ